MNVNEALNYFLSKVAPELDALGLIRNKKGNSWIIKDGPFKLVLDINVSPGLSNKSSVLFHTIFNIYRDDLSDYVLVLENFLREKKSMPSLKNKRPLLGVTDWLEIYQENNKTDSGVWFATLAEVDGNKNFEKDFQELIGFALFYFSECKRLDFCLDKLKNRGFLSSNLAFVALASSIGREFLHEKYSELQQANFGKVGWNESEMKSALHFLEKNPFKPKYIVE